MAVLLKDHILISLSLSLFPNESPSVGKLLCSKLAVTVRLHHNSTAAFLFCALSLTSLGIRNPGSAISTF